MIQNALGAPTGGAPADRHHAPEISRAPAVAAATLRGDALRDAIERHLLGDATYTTDELLSEARAEIARFTADIRRLRIFDEGSPT